MARPVYSRRLIATIVESGLPADFIVLDEETLVVRDVQLLINADTSQGDIFSLTLDGFAICVVGIPAGGVYVYSKELRGVAPGPTVLTAQLTFATTALVECYVSGYLLTP